QRSRSSVLLLHELGTMPDGIVRNWRILHSEPLLPACTVAGAASCCRALKMGAEWGWLFTQPGPKEEKTPGHDLVDPPDQICDRDGVRTKLLGEPIQIGIRNLLEAGFVNAGHYFDPDRFQPVSRLVLKINRLAGLAAVDLVGRSLDPFTLVGGKAFPQLVTDPNQAVIGLVLRHRKDRRNLVVLVGKINVDAVFGDVDDARLQRGVDAAERHVLCLRSVRREHGVLSRRRLDTDLQTLDIVYPIDLTFGVHVA